MPRCILGVFRQKRALAWKSVGLRSYNSDKKAYVNLFDRLVWALRYRFPKFFHLSETVRTGIALTEQKTALNLGFLYL